ncbi:hypothetical protein HU200_001126 [Digitaria exilis]|uniref:Uncharacterized protein n=1 Tax=Digitaria exilis TaxID=1010633 RepID=A0A835KWZ0_9POAL|nr:hypothetical protein HU200_001126 [Digitaria exilis]
MSSCVAPYEARRLMEETRTTGEACAAGGCHSPVDGSLTAMTKPDSDDDHVPTTPGHGPSIGHP